MLTELDVHGVPSVVPDSASPFAHLHEANPGVAVQ
jgi:hypothetical protein